MDNHRECTLSIYFFFLGQHPLRCSLLPPFPPTIWRRTHTGMQSARISTRSHATFTKSSSASRGHAAAAKEPNSDNSSWVSRAKPGGKLVIVSVSNASCMASTSASISSTSNKYKLSNASTWGLGGANAQWVGENASESQL